MSGELAAQILPWIASGLSSLVLVVWQLVRSDIREIKETSKEHSRKLEETNLKLRGLNGDLRKYVTDEVNRLKDSTRDKMDHLAKEQRRATKEAIEEQRARCLREEEISGVHSPPPGWPPPPHSGQ
jgi:hypothetical protein